MKKITCIILFLAAICKVNGTVHTVSNDPNKPADFNSVSAALAASLPGDTLYIYGTSNDYGNLTIDKSITLIGAGFNTRKEMFNKSNFTSIDFAAGTVSNVELNGITCIHLGLPFGVVYHYSNITIRNCNLNSGFSSIGGNGSACGSTLSNWLIENSYMGDFSVVYNNSCGPANPATSGFLVRRSIIASIGGGAMNMTFANCSFGLNAGCVFARNQNCSFNNCIFNNASFDQSTNTTGNVFNNCLTYQTSFPSAGFDLNNWTNGGSGTANNCIINQNPLWITPPQLQFFFPNPTSFANSWDPSIPPASPAHNAGTDGTDIGLTGSATPFNFRAEPGISVVRNFQLVNATVPSNGTVTIKVTATKAQ